MTMDVREEDAIAKIIPEVKKDIGPFHILVNNAGIQRRGK
jgi:NADP-dependent 3-hydroxy acid dehydrogenase YdfG